MPSPARSYPLKFALMLLFFTMAGLLIAATSHAGDPVPDVNWVDWQTVLPNTDIEGTAQAGSSTVTVTYSGEREFVQLGCGTNYWNPSAPYISATVPNAPPDCDIIALSHATTKTLTFSEPVSDIFFAVVSLNGNGYSFDRDFDILSFGLGYWGNGTLTKQVTATTWDLIGSGEPHGVIQLTGTFSSVSWTSLSNENWNGFSIAFQDTVANLEATPPVPVPTIGNWALMLMGIFILGLGILVMRKKVLGVN